MGPSARSAGLSHAGGRRAAYSALARSHLKAFARDESGATAIEYALLATIITVGLITAVTSIGNTLVKTFSDVKNGFNP
jgi:pilus assembly protein Flp/PilA